MRTRAFYTRLCLLTLFLWVGFGLRLHDLLLPNLNIDETWSYLNSYYLVHPAGYSAAQILLPEPNNALHLVLMGITLIFVPHTFGARWFSVMVGMITVALAARIGFRLYGRRAGLIAGLMTALAYAPVIYSQDARPYMLATLLALLSTLLWLEKRPRLNMLAAALVPLAHIGAMPVVVVQDAVFLRDVLRGRRMRRMEWIVRRVPVYALFLLIIYAAYQQRPIHVISSGQTPPSPADLLNFTLNVIVNGFPALTAATAIFLIGVILPLIGLAIWRGRRIDFTVPLLWIIFTYGFLIAGAVLSDGPIKWLHITHVAIALVLIMAALLARAPRLLIAGVLVAYCAAASLLLINFYQNPYQYWSDTLAQIDPFRQGDEPIYLQQPTVLWSLQINEPSARYVQYLPDADTRATRYLYVEMEGWDPPAPPECAPTPLWSNSQGLRLLDCTHR